MRLIAGALLAAAACAPALAQPVAYQPAVLPAPGASVCTQGLCQPEALAPLFERLAALEAGEGGMVHVLQLGDSHTAGDRITGRLRAVLQGRFGPAGRGALAAGVPYPGYAPMQVQVTAEDWSIAPAPAVGPNGYGLAEVGLAGMTRPTYGPRPVLRLALDPGAEAVRVWLCGRRGPEGDDFDLTVEDAMLPVPMQRVAPGMGCALRTLPRPARMIEVRPHGQGAVAYSLMLEGNGNGVIVSNLGVVGATLRDLAARDEAVVQAELTAWRPALIVLAYGANEGFEPGLDASAYQTLLRGQVARFRRLAPGAALMILGAPDALMSGAAVGCSADGVRAPPAALAAVRDVQRRVAQEMGVAFWDWHGRMGGDCAADRLALLAEPLMRPDRVHFTSTGADWIGGILADDLMAAFGAWKALSGGTD